MALVKRIKRPVWLGGLLKGLRTRAGGMAQGGQDFRDTRGEARFPLGVMRNHWRLFRQGAAKSLLLLLVIIVTQH